MALAETGYADLARRLGNAMHLTVRVELVTHRHNGIVVPAIMVEADNGNCMYHAESYREVYVWLLGYAMC